MTVTTPPLYAASAEYTLIDHNLASGAASRGRSRRTRMGGSALRSTEQATRSASLGPGTGAEPPVLLPITPGDKLRLRPNERFRCR
jgi:hypothetical protein